MTLKEFITLYGQGKRGCEPTAFDYECIFDNGGWDPYETEECMIDALRPYLDDDVSFNVDCLDSANDRYDVTVSALCNDGFGGIGEFVVLHVDCNDDPTNW